MSHPDDKPDCPFCPAPLYKHACPTDSRPSNAPSEVEVEWTTNDDLNADPPGAPDSRPSASRNETKAIEDLYEKAQTLIDEAFYIGLNYAESPQRKALDRIARTLDDEQRPSDACSKCGAVDPGDVYVYGMSFLSTENGKRICRDRDACARHSNDARIGYPCACTWVGKNEEARATLKPCEMHRIWAEGLRLDKVPGTGTLLLASGICLTAGEVDEVLAARRTDYPTVDRIRYGTEALQQIRRDDRRSDSPRSE